MTAKENRKLEIKVGISYEADIQKAKTILEKILKDDPDTKSDSREMVVFVDELAESAVIMGLRVWAVSYTHLVSAILYTTTLQNVKKYNLPVYKIFRKKVGIF